MDIFNAIIAIISSAIIAFIIGFLTIRHKVTEAKALANQEVSKSDQEKIVTADKTIDLYTKLTEKMDLEFGKMNNKITKLEDELEQYVIQCKACPNNKITKKKHP